MPKNQLVGLWVAVTLTGCAGTALRQDFPPVPLPTIESGDTWRYRISDGFSREVKGAMQVEVVKVGPESIVARISEDARVPGVERTYTAGWNPGVGRTPVGLPLEPFTHGIASGQTVEYTPAYPALRFPLEPGKRWNERILATDPETHKRVAVRVRARVVGGERIRVPAGEFEAIKVQREVFYEDAEWWRSPINALEIDWYAPQARQVVRRYLESQFLDYSSGRDDGGPELRLGDRLVFELESYPRVTSGQH